MAPTTFRARFVPIALLLASAALPLAAFDSAATWWFPSCPLCGSLHALLTGAPLTALAFNPLTITGIVAWLLARERTTALCFSARGLAFVLAFGVLRNVPGASGCLGFVVCILPGIYLGVGYVFAIPLVIDKKG